MRLFHVFLLGFLSTSPVLAEDMMDRARAAVGTTSGIDRTSQAASDAVVPDYTAPLPFASAPSPTQLETDGLLRAAGNSTEADTYRQFGISLPQWSPSAVPSGALNAADLAVSDPYAHIQSGFFTSSDATGQLCQVDAFTASPTFTRACDRAAQIVNGTCFETPVVTATVTQRFECQGLFYPRADSCIPLDINPNCQTDSEAPCRVPDPNFPGGCNPFFETKVCVSDTLMTTSHVEVGSPVWDVQTGGVTRVCDPVTENPTCKLLQRTCPGGPTVTFIGGTAVPLACAQWQEDYACTSGTTT